MQGEHDVRAHRLRREFTDDDFAHDSAAVNENVDRQAVYVILIPQRAGVHDDRIDQVMSAAKATGLARVLENVNPDDLQTLRSVGAGECINGRCLLVARRAPGGEEIQIDGFPV
jgi:methylmalonyl-CoA mutase cobalamin-binding subunit